VEGSELTPAEHRGLRELYAAGRQLAGHWASLADLLDPPAARTFAHGAGEAGDLLDALRRETERRRLYGRVAARGAGRSLAAARSALSQPFLEVNQAVRLAVLDAQHLGTLLGYLERLAGARRDEGLAAFHAAWRLRIEELELAGRKSAVALGDDPEAATAPVRSDPAGRAGHAVAMAVGTAGERLDAMIGPRLSGRH
jgi:hypothetical protein